MKKMKKGIMMIYPSKKTSKEPVIDELTKKMTAAWRKQNDEKSVAYKGHHVCACGVRTDNWSHWLKGEKSIETNMLAIHYLAFHRNDVPEKELRKVMALTFGQSKPTKYELQDPKQYARERNTYG